MDVVAKFVSILINVLMYAIIIRALITWFPISPGNPLVRLLDDITEPILAPLRQVVPRLGMLDITPIVAIFILMGLGAILDMALHSAM